MNRFRSALVTGASGFIGRALVRRLVQQGVAVTCLGRPTSAPTPGVDQIRVSEFSIGALRPALADRTFDAVFHLAAYGVPPTERDPSLLFRVNVAGTADLLTALAQCGAKAFVYVGSCSEYSDPPPGVLVGEDFPVACDGLYGASKAAGGLWARALGASLGVNVAWLRLFGVYGPGEAPYRLIPSILAQLTRNEEVALSSGDQVRDLLYVDDVVEGLIASANAAMVGRLGPLNLCSGRPVAVKAVATAVADALGKPRALLGFGKLPYRAGEILWLVGSPARLLEATGFQPRTTLEAGIASMIAAETSGRTLLAAEAGQR